MKFTSTGLVLFAVCAVEIATTRDIRDAWAVIVSSPMNASEVHRGRGIACKVDGHLGPASYLVEDIGKTGVPRLDSDEVKLVTRIQQYVHSPYLRFTIADFELVVFNVNSAHLCEQQGAPFFVLNGECNEYYTPAGDNMDSTFAAPNCIYPRRPWMNGDRGKSDPKFDWSGALH